MVFHCNANINGVYTDLLFVNPAIQPETTWRVVNNDQVFRLDDSVDFASAARMTSCIFEFILTDWIFNSWQAIFLLLCVTFCRNHDFDWLKSFLEWQLCAHTTQCLIIRERDQELHVSVWCSLSVVSPYINLNSLSWVLFIVSILWLYLELDIIHFLNPAHLDPGLV